MTRKLTPYTEQEIARINQGRDMPDMVRVRYEIYMDIELSDQTDLISIMDNLANAIERARMEGMITGVEDTETVVGSIVLSYPDAGKPTGPVYSLKNL